MQDSEQEKITDVRQFDAAGKSLSDALRVSFVILKVIMILLLLVFLASGFRTVASDEQAIVLRFGKIHGIGEDRILLPGLHWIFPYPIDEILKIPVTKKVNLPINSFWHTESQRIRKTLDPVVDGYCITRGAKQTHLTGDTGGSDYNIVHNKWQLVYRIDDPIRFFENVYIDPEDINPGQSYADAIDQNIQPILKDIFASAVVTAMVHYTIDEVMFEKVGKVNEHIKKLLQANLDKIESGIKVVSVQSTADIVWPRQVHEAFLASIKASQMSQTVINEAKTYAENTLSEAGGSVADQLLEAMKDKTVSEEAREVLWDQLAGAAQKTIYQARAYRTKIVTSAKANADYLLKILPEYRQRPELVVKEIYQQAIESILEKIDEKIIIQPTEGTKGKELRILLNRDPSIKRK